MPAESGDQKPKRKACERHAEHPLKRIEFSAVLFQHFAVAERIGKAAMTTGTTLNSIVRPDREPAC